MAKVKKEADGEHPSSHYLVVEDPNEPSKWHLRVKGPDGKPDHRLMGAAWAALHRGYRGNTYEGPNKEEAISKLKGMYRSEGMDTPSTTSSEDPRLVWPLLSEYVERKRIPIALTGTWVRAGKKFSITLDHMKQMMANFLKRKNGEVNLDYDHASEMLHKSNDGTIPSAGRVTALEEPEEMPNGRYILWGLCEPTERAAELVKSREYRYISPAINFAGEDKETGEDQGATLTSVGLTNRPFLDGMPQVQLSDPSFQLIDTNSVHVDGADPKFSVQNKEPASAGKGAEVKTYKVKKLADGEHKGKHGIFDGENMMGLADVEPDADDQRKMQAAEERFAQLLTDEGFEGQTEEQVRSMIRDGIQAQEREKAGLSMKTLLTECIVGTGLDMDKAFKFARKGVLSEDDYNAAREAQRRVERAIEQGRLLPRCAGQALRLFLSDKNLFRDLIEEGKPRLPLNPAGASRGMEATEGDFRAMVKAREAEKKIPYRQALSEVSREHPEMARAYNESQISKGQ